MTDVLVSMALVVGSATGPALALWWAHRGPALAVEARRRREDRGVRRQMSLVRSRVERGATGRRTERALHNDFDMHCVHWWGDRNPAAADPTNRDFGGRPTGFTERRCLVCRPYTGDEADHLVEQAP